MTTDKPTRTARRGKIFPEIQWATEQKTQWKAEREEFRKRCQVIFDRVKPSLMKTHYNWYITIEPLSGEYFVNKDDMHSAQMAHDKYPGAFVVYFPH